MSPHVTLVTVPPESLVTTEITASRDKTQTGDVVSAIFTFPVVSCDGTSFLTGIYYLSTERRTRVTSQLKTVTVI